MQTTYATARARQLTNAVVIKNNKASVGRVTFEFSTTSGFVDFTGVDEYLEVHPIFSVCSNKTVVRRYNDHMQAITIALGLRTYCVGTTEITIVPDVEPVSRVDLFGDYVVGGRPAREPRPLRFTAPDVTLRVDPVVRLATTSRAGLFGALVVLGAVAVIGALLADD